jgi:simple sugar transport system substrate-binding protein
VPSLDDRVKGMLDGLKGVDVTIVGKGATNCTEEPGISVAEDLLTKIPELKAIFAACAPPAAGAAQAIKNAGIANDRSCWLVSTSAAERGKLLRRKSKMRPRRSSPAKMAELGADALVKSIGGEKVESLIDSGAALVTKDNMVSSEPRRGPAPAPALAILSVLCWKWQVITCST